jgi:hypothetical protein
MVTSPLDRLKVAPSSLRSIPPKERIAPSGCLTIRPQRQERPIVPSAFDNLDLVPFMIAIVNIQPRRKSPSRHGFYII